MVVRFDFREEPGGVRTAHARLVADERTWIQHPDRVISIRGRAKNTGSMARCFAKTEILRLLAQIDTLVLGSDWLPIQLGKTASSPELDTARCRYWTTIDPFIFGWNSQK